MSTTLQQTHQQKKSITIIADENISHLDDYFNIATLSDLSLPVKIIKTAGRLITPELLEQHQPIALLIRSVTKVNASLLSDNQSIKFIGSATIGTDHVDQSYLLQKGIQFANAAGCSKHSVAQYVLTAALTLNPKFWQSTPTIGIIGLGNIGKTLALYAHTLGWHVLGYDPFLEQDTLNNNSLNDVLANSDIISLHVPLSTQNNSEHPTYHLLNEATINLMRPDTMLINSARGQVIKEAALLADKKLHPNRYIVLDVYEHEPEVSATLINQLSIATPHIAGYTLEGKLRGTDIIYQAFCQYFDIKVTQNLANLVPDNPYKWSDVIKQPELLTQYYDIKTDDKLLRDLIKQNKLSKDDTNNSSNVHIDGHQFDALRKNYTLKREWLFKESTSNQ